MGKAAAKADIPILTSDNPRTEDPLTIILQTEKGLLEAGFTPQTFEEQGKKVPSPNPEGIDVYSIPTLRHPSAKKSYIVEPDRQKAISIGVRLLKEGDVLLVAGKGHEDYQIVGTQKRHFDDREVVRDVATQLKNSLRGF
jgi:UDP-N-acetylmuramoyl-L-alanyl-D-glutamate--2,6-diaminopimelate ligase